MQTRFVTYQSTLSRAFWLGFISYLFAFTITGFSQAIDTSVYTVVEQPPEFPGGFKAMKNYLLTNVYYPPEAKKAGVKDRVIMSFIIEPDGRITDIRLVRGIGHGCDEEAVRVIRAMPYWIPGSQSGRPLRVKYNLPVLFGIDYPKPKKH